MKERDNDDVVEIYYIHIYGDRLVKTKTRN